MDSGRTGVARPLWAEADRLRERVAEANGLYAFFSFEAALAQRAVHGHLRTNPAARSALLRLSASANARCAVLSGRKVELLESRLRLQRIAYVGVHGAQIAGLGLRLVTEPDQDQAEISVARLKKACSRVPELQAQGCALEDRTWALVLHLRHCAPVDAVRAAEQFAQLAAGEGMRLRRSDDSVTACPQLASLSRAVQGLLAGARGSLPVYVGSGEEDEECFGTVNRLGGLTVHVGAPPRAGTSARWQVADGTEVIRLMQWLSDARRRR